MAPRGKRSAADAGSGSVSKKCKTVRDALVMYEGVQSSVLEMLGSNLGACIGIAKEDRHEFQQQVVEMIGEMLEGMEAAFKANIEAEEAVVKSSEEEKKSRDEAKSVAEQTAADKVQATAVAKTALAEASDSFKQATEALATAETEQKAGEADYEQNMGKKTKLESTVNSTYTPLKAGTMEASLVATSISAVVALGKEFGFDPALLGSLPSALSKAADARGSFDTMCCAQLEDEVAKRIAELDGILSSGETAKLSLASKVEAAKSALEAARQAEQSCIQVHKDAEESQKQAAAAAKEAAKAAKQYEPEVKRAHSSLDAAKKKLVSLQEGALADYKSLEERSNAIVNEPAATEAAAPEPVAVAA